MQMTLADSELENFVLDQVRGGQFKSPDDVLRSAVSLMRQSLESKKLEDLRAAIKVGLDQVDRGETSVWNRERNLGRGQGTDGQRAGGLIMPRIVYSKESNWDVVDIITPLAAENPTAAADVLVRIENTLSLLSEHPLAGTARTEIAPDLRSLPVEKFRQYIVFYRPLADGIEVIRILHGSRDITAIFR